MSSYFLIFPALIGKCLTIIYDIGWILDSSKRRNEAENHSFLVLQDKIQDMTNARNGSRSNQIYMIVHGGSND